MSSEEDGRVTPTNAEAVAGIAYLATLLGERLVGAVASLSAARREAVINVAADLVRAMLAPGDEAPALPSEERPKLRAVAEEKR